MTQERRPPSPTSSAKEEDEDQYGRGPLTLEELDEKYPQRPRNHSLTFYFSELFKSLFNPLSEIKAQPAGPRGPRRHGPSKLSPHDQRRAVIERFISRWRTDVGNDFYPALRLILPDKDRDRGVYKLKESAIGKLLVKIMKIDRNSDDGSALLHWKLPGNAGGGARLAGDFAGRCYEIIKKRPMRTEPGDMRIAEVNVLLDQLAGASGEAEQVPILDVFYKRMNAEELMWLIRIILKEMKVGATERTFLNLWHPNGVDLFSVSSSLRRVCWELYDPNFRLEQEDTGVTLMQCFQPQLAQFQMPATFEKMVDHLGVSDKDPEYWIEEKLDGERMQMHMMEDPNHPGGWRFCFWSRKAKDYTDLYGDGFEDNQSALTRHLKNAFVDGVRNCILDGEMITWDPKTEKIVAFGTLKTAALAARTNPFDTECERPVFRVFDILYLNDTALTQYTLRKRREALEKAVKGVDGRLEILPHIKARSSDAIEPELRRVIAEASEGLVLKNPRSLYRLNSRNDDWIKVKPEYMSEFGESLDCVVVGGYFGSGHRGGRLSSFMCGLRVSENYIQAGANPEKCFSFFKVGGGFRAEDYAEIRHHTDGKWVDWDPKKPPSEYIELGGGEKFQYERPDVWIRPKDSIIISVKAAEIVPSDQFATSETLRFPRFRQLRLDRSWDSGLDVDQFQLLKSRVDKEIHEKKDMSIENRRRSRPTKRAKRELVIVGTEGAAPAKFAEKPKTKVFEGLRFFVTSESLKPKMSRVDLQALIKENGGQIQLKEDRETGSGLIIVADKNVAKAASLVKYGTFDIVRPKWIFDCLSQAEEDYLLPFEPSHLFFGTEPMKALAEKNVDEFGDSYARDVGVDELREIMKKMSEERDRDRNFDQDEFLNQLEEHGHELPQLKRMLFRRCHVVFAIAGGVPDTKALVLKNFVRFGSGQVGDDVDDKEATHVVIVGKDEASEREVAATVRHNVSSRRKVPRIITPRWIEDCWNEKTLIDEERYAPS